MQHKIAITAYNYFTWYLELSWLLLVYSFVTVINFTLLNLMIWYSLCLCVCHSPYLVLLHALLFFWCSGLTLSFCHSSYCLAIVWFPSSSICFAISWTPSGWMLATVFALMCLFYGCNLFICWVCVAFAFHNWIIVSVLFQTIKHGSLICLCFYPLCWH